VVINKIKNQLLDKGVVLEEAGGEIPAIEISALKGTNLDKLLENILVVYDLNHKEIKSTFSATVLESRFDKRKGYIDNIILKKGEINVGDTLYNEKKESFKVKALIDWNKKQVKKITSGQPAEILGSKIKLGTGESLFKDIKEIEIENIKEKDTEEIVHVDPFAKLVKKKNLELSKELKVKSYLQMRENSSEGSGFRLRAGRPIQTNKASFIEKLRGCVTVIGNPNERGKTKVLYLQFLNPDMKVIEDNANTVSVGGNVYSKRVELQYLGKEFNLCDAITVPEGSLEQGIYTLNIFEEERLLSSTEFQLK